jgi:hypothetical protein
MDRGLATMEGCLVQANGGTGLLIHHGATVQARNCVFSEGRSLGVDCAEGGQGVLDVCEISGNAGAGVQVEPGGSLLPSDPGGVRGSSQRPRRNPARQRCCGSDPARRESDRGRIPEGGRRREPGEGGAGLGLRCVRS